MSKNVLNKFDTSWNVAFGQLLLHDLLKPVADKLTEERKEHKVLPLQGSDLLFEAFKQTPISKVKVVIVGQDPYHDGSFNGLAFGNGEPFKSYPVDKLPKKLSPSLNNVLTEVIRTSPTKDANSTIDPSLYAWAEQGVLLINTAHTVIKGQPESHLEMWAQFTNYVFRALQLMDNVVWMLWGRKAAAYQEIVTNKTHKIIITGHPSPLNRSNPFVGSNCFKECNNYLKSVNKPQIRWMKIPKLGLSLM
jgi:uracil-DNA glycosylase